MVEPDLLHPSEWRDPGSTSSADSFADDTLEPFFEVRLFFATSRGPLDEITKVDLSKIRSKRILSIVFSRSGLPSFMSRGAPQGCRYRDMEGEPECFGLGGKR